MSIKTWKTVLILSLVIPIGLVVSFRAANVTRGPLEVSEIVKLDTVSREFERPGFIADFDKVVESHYNGDVAINQTISLFDFWAQNSRYGDSATLEMAFNVTSQVNGGFIEDLNLTFEDGYKDASIHFMEYFAPSVMNGLSVSNRTSQARRVFMQLSGVDSPKNVSLYLPITWVLNSPYSQAHQLNVTSEITYYNGTVYKEVVQPFQLKLTPDSNRNLASATEIHAGTYTQLYLGGEDNTDFYKIHLDQGQTANVEVNDTLNFEHYVYPLFQVYVYDPEGNVVVSGDSQDLYATVKEVQFQVTSTSYWYIEIRCINMMGFYSLTVGV